MNHAIDCRALLVLDTMLLGAVTANAAQSSQELADNAELTARVKAALIADETTKARQIDIETYRDIIQLSGYVGTNEESMRAERLVASVRGVLEVRNALKIRQWLADKATSEAVDDATLTTRVKAALVADESTKAHEIKVETDVGVVQLSGFVSDDAESARARHVALAVDGVRQVRNDLQIAPAR